ncbi:type IV pilus modification PilV family protein [Psychromonas hadalis]|uniref:type IV pilus modification PilV family protein n=1 Tax=Psychromonas hadalis TaxID=211669 RepID=UPI0003B520B0|nr:prepilin-type N-terminal cleavage/methylation domain-containing protein [Psychromonas hadalis]
MVNKNGFSLVEILVSLFVVSLVAVNISGLQKMVGDQNRDNFSHTAVVKLATGKFEEIMKLKTIAEVDLLTGLTPASVLISNTVFDLDWTVTNVAGAGGDIRNVKLKVSWKDSSWRNTSDAKQTFTYSEQVSLAMLLKGAGGGTGEEWGYTIPNLLNTNKVGYFEANMGYKRGAYVIYNSQLFHSTSVHSVGNGGNDPRDLDPPISYEGESGSRIATVSDGWENLGRIDNADLVSLFQ